jgi:hypothetical protein
VNDDLYYEEQKFTNQLVIGLAILPSILTVGIFGWGMVRQLAFDHQWGSKPMSDPLLAIVGVLVMSFTLTLTSIVVFLRMTTRVSDLGVTVRFWGIVVRRAPLSRIVECEAIHVNSLREFGGWGIRWRPGQGWAYNVASGGTVRLSLDGGGTLVIGSRRAEELAAVIAEAIKTD